MSSCNALLEHHLLRQTWYEFNVKHKVHYVQRKQIDCHKVFVKLMHLLTATRTAPEHVLG